MSGLSSRVAASCAAPMALVLMFATLSELAHQPSEHHNPHGRNRGEKTEEALRSLAAAGTDGRRVVCDFNRTGGEPKPQQAVTVMTWARRRLFNTSQTTSEMV